MRDCKCCSQNHSLELDGTWSQLCDLCFKKDCADFSLKDEVFYVRHIAHEGYVFEPVDIVGRMANDFERNIENRYDHIEGLQESVWRMFRRYGLKNK